MNEKWGEIQGSTVIYYIQQGEFYLSLFARANEGTLGQNGSGWLVVGAGYKLAPFSQVTFSHT